MPVHDLADVHLPQRAERCQDAIVIREDRELLAEMARLNSEMASLALRMMEGSASAAEQHSYAQRLIAAGQQLTRRAHGMSGIVIEGQTLATDTIALPGPHP